MSLFGLYTQDVVSALGVIGVLDYVNLFARNCGTLHYDINWYFYCCTRFDEDVGKVELDYPRDMSMWSGVGYNIDTVFQWKDGEY
jgi:matrix metalloproteinase-16 (membrane-inserted)